MNAPASIVKPEQLAVELEFTRVYQESRNAPVALRELRCLEILLPARFQAPQPGDLFAGRVKHPLCGFSPQPGGYGYYCNESAIRGILASGAGDEAWRRQVEAMLEFWKDENSSAKTRAAYPQWVAETLPVDRLDVISASYPLYRMGGTQLDYGKLLKLGIPGMMREVELSKSLDSDAPLREGLLGALKLLSGVAKGYARRLNSERPPFISAKEREEMAGALDSISRRAPESFREASQLLWLASLAAGSWNYGRLDVVLGPFLARDLDSGRLDEESAIELISSLWRLMHALEAKFDNRVTVGGLGRENEADADRFALLAIEAARRVHLNQPQLTLRFSKSQNPALLEKAYDALGGGLTFPLLYNDDVNVPAVAKAMELPLSEALDYLPFGCGEYMIWKRGIATPSGAINLAKCLELALHEGRCALTGEVLGSKTGLPSSFEELWQAYATQVERQARALAKQQKVEYDVAGREAAFLYFSLLSDDCIARGKAMFDGGIRHLAGTLETYGNTDVSDALAAVRRAVFEEKAFSMQDLLEAMDKDWAGAEAMRAHLLSIPKYGNNQEEADSMAVRVHEHVCRVTREQARAVGLSYYLVVIINNSMNVDLGRMTAALPDGRMAKAPLANGNNPVAGRDTQGVTSFLSSLLKLSPEIHAGAVQNMKFGKEFFSKKRALATALLATYWKNGGAQAMITVLGRGDLEAAMREPEKWGHLMVRVGGFSERFVKLPKDLQKHILERTLNE